MRITKEWAKQLAYEIWGDADYADMKIEYVKANTEKVKVALFPLVISGYKPTMVHDLITLKPINDPINKEITYLGYSRDANTLFVGETKSHE